MVGAVNRVPPASRVQPFAVPRNPTPVARPAQGEAATDPASDILNRTRKAEMETLLASLASAPPGAEAQAANSLQAAERTLTRLKAEARAAATSGDRRAARSIARDLAVVARQIADAAQDYAVAQAQPDIVSPALAKAAARMNVAAPTGAGGAVDAGALIGEASAAAAEAAQAAAGAADPARPDSAGISGESLDVHQPGDSAKEPAGEPGRAPNGSSPIGSSGTQDDDILVQAHRLFEEAMDLLRAMETLIGGQPARAGRAEPGALPVWPLLGVTAGAARRAGGTPMPVAPHGR